ncbi:MAG: class I SAM-dependent methyltransferase [Microbacteriaceae bacterium]|nr:MAG: class I SAM-dependent methyltransferase [Microbacteriaceae bacterium]
MGAEEHPFDRDYWENRYGAPGLAWSGDPNPVLVTEVTGLTPGRALDVGSGEGGDAIWLAMQGWQVTGVDIAVNALDKARLRAESLDRAAAERIDWQQRDLTTWSPEPLCYDLVSSQFMHLPQPHRTMLFRSLAAAVAPGGTLLIVGHDVSDADAGAHREHLRELMFTVDEVVAAIDGEHLSVEMAESRVRKATGVADGADTGAGSSGAGSSGADLRDVVVKATRVR